MKKTSKFLSMVLALVMAFALAVPAFAAEDIEHCDDYGKVIIKNPTGHREVQGYSNQHDYSKATYDLYEITVGTEQTTLFNKYFDDNAGKDSKVNVDGEKYFYVYVYEANLRADGTFGFDASCIDEGGCWGPYTVEDNYFYYWASAEPEEGTHEELYYIYVDICASPNMTDVVSDGSYDGFLINVKYDPAQTSASTTTTTTTVKPAPGVSVPLNDGTGEFAYTIKYGDSLSKIAAYYYGDMNVYKLIFERNKDVLKNANTIYAGQVITLPSYAAVAASKAPAEKPAEPEKPEETQQPETPAAVKPAPGVSVLLDDGTGEFAYTIKSGDSLSKIAAYYYGDVNVYKLIFERNKDTIKNANTIRVGQTIILPSYAAVAEFQAAAK